MKMKCGCESSWNQLNLDRNEESYCLTHNTYEVESEGANDEVYNDYPILLDEEYEVINQKYAEDIK